jgi:CRP-like cAMP-binding protein
LQTLTLAQENFVFEEGDQGKEFYIIEEGEVDCLKKSNSTGKLMYVRTLMKGDHFGELALINNKNRSLSIKAASPELKLLKLDRETFTRILGSIENHLKMDYGVPSPARNKDKDQTFASEVDKVKT